MPFVHEGLTLFMPCRRYDSDAGDAKGVQISWAGVSACCMAFAAWLLLHGFCCMAFAAWLLALINDPDASDLQAMLLFATCVSQTCFLAVEFSKLVSSNLWQ